jgi:hypothetical protein
VREKALNGRHAEHHAAAVIVCRSRDLRWNTQFPTCLLVLDHVPGHDITTVTSTQLGAISVDGHGNRTVCRQCPGIVSR